MITVERVLRRWQLFRKTGFKDLVAFQRTKTRTEIQRRKGKGI